MEHRRCAWGKLCVASLLILQAATITAAADVDRIGIYHWAGQLTTSMSAGVERIVSLGGQVARVAYAPTYYPNYGVKNECYPNYSLSALAREPDVQRALDNPAIRVFILTAYDGVTLGDCYQQKFLSPAFYTAENVAAIRAEYSDFVVYLFRRYNGTHRRFILSNWESDNAVFCGAAYNYAINPEFRAHCDTNYPFLYLGNANSEQSLLGLRHWFEAREAGIADGLARAQSLGLSGLEVLHAPEINIVRKLHEQGLPSVLYNVLTAFRPTSVSYSSYESLNNTDAGSRLSIDIETIRNLTRTSAIIVGEASYNRSDPHCVAKLTTALQTALKAGVLYFIYWNLNEQDQTNSYGLYDLTDRLTPMGEALTAILRNGLQQPASRTQPNIGIGRPALRP